MKEFSALTSGQKEKLTNRLKGKVAPRPWAKRQGWYPEKQANKLMTYLKHAAKKQENLPLKKRNFINVWEGEKFVGVKDVRKNTLWTHVDYDLTGKKGTVITEHPGQGYLEFADNCNSMARVLQLYHLDQKGHKNLIERLLKLQP